MATYSGIQCTNATWNPVTGCTRVSAGCDNCYAVQMTARLESMGSIEKYGGLTVLNQRGERHFNGKIRTHDDVLTIPLRWKKPRMIFVNSMSDLFHRDVPFEFIDKVCAVMGMARWHTFQVLTKRPERMGEYQQSRSKSIKYFDEAARSLGYTLRFDVGDRKPIGLVKFPLPNVWWGTSVEDSRAIHRVDDLRRVPAAIRFLSCEPLIGALDNLNLGGIDWVIVGGESGSNARPFNVQWARSIVEQCKAAGVACFVKQLGSVPVIAPDVMDAWPDYPNYKHSIMQDGMIRIRLRDSKGGDWNEWPDDLRVREFPRSESERVQTDTAMPGGRRR